MQLSKVIRSALQNDSLLLSLLPLKLVLLAPLLPLLSRFPCVRVLSLLPFFASITFAAAYVGVTDGGMSLQVQQSLPPGKWLHVREGGCLLGEGAHLVVDPERPNIEEALADRDFIGRQLCDWLSMIQVHHDSVSSKHRSRIRKRSFLNKVWKPLPENTFLSALHVTLTHLDLEDFQEVLDTPGHIPLPWAQLTFTYYSPRDRDPIHFCGTSFPCSEPVHVHVLLTPEVSLSLREEAGVPVDQTVPPKISSGSTNEEEDDKEIASEVSNGFQMIPVRTFHWLDPECICLDGRLMAPDSGLCAWALKKRKDFPSASATLLFTSVSLFVGKYAQITGRLQLENPAYSVHRRSITFYVKPLQSRAVLARNHYYDKAP